MSELPGNRERLTGMPMKDFLLWSTSPFAMVVVCEMKLTERRFDGLGDVV